MLKSYLSIAWRKLVKNRVSSTINMAGLCVGIAAFLLISAHVINELSCDNFHHKKDRIYRVQLKRYMNNVLSTEWAWGCTAIGPALKENLPEVENYVIMSWAIATVSYQDTLFKEPRGRATLCTQHYHHLRGHVQHIIQTRSTKRRTPSYFRV